MEAAAEISEEARVVRQGAHLSAPPQAGPLVDVRIQPRRVRRQPLRSTTGVVCPRKNPDREEAGGLVRCRPRVGPIQPFQERIDDRRVQEFVRERRHFGRIAEQREGGDPRRRSVEIPVGRVTEASVGFLPSANPDGQVHCAPAPGSVAGRGEDADCRRRPVQIGAVGTFRARVPPVAE